MTHETAHRTGLIPVLCFLLLTYGITFGIQYYLIADGIRFDGDIVRHTPLHWLLLIMWAPGLAALVALKLEGSREKLGQALKLRLGSLAPFCLVLFLVPLIFAAIYGITWLFGLASPDFSMASLRDIAGSRDDVTPETVLQVYLPMSIFLGPILHFLFSLGEEIGWRGYLLPRLLPLGKAKAYILLGLLWGLWHAPIILVGFNYPGHPIAGLAMMCLLTTAFGFFLNEMTLHYKSVLLAAFIHAAVNAQGFGVWHWLFPDVNPLIGGPTGLVGVAVWCLVGFGTVGVLKKLRQA